MASLWLLGLGWVMVAVIWARWSAGGPREASALVGLTAGLGGVGATLIALRVLARRRPWLFLAWQCTFHCGRSRWSAGGLAAAAHAAAGVVLPGDPVGQYLATAGSGVPDGKLEVGDLVFWAVVPATPASICHVGIYVGAGLVLGASPGCGQVLVQRCEQVRPLAPDDWWREGDIRAAAVVYRATRPLGPTARDTMSSVAGGVASPVRVIGDLEVGPVPYRRGPGEWT
jgi:predicted RNA-binding Zn-ribbon protein involved in translation (DUF1610 family)